MFMLARAVFRFLIDLFVMAVYALSMIIWANLKELRRMISKRKIIHFCPVEKRNVGSDYCDSIHCEMCGDDQCLGVEDADMKHDFTNR